MSHASRSRNPVLREVAFYGSALATGLFAGGLAFVWHENGAAIFLAMSESLLAWCF